MAMDGFIDDGMSAHGGLHCAIKTRFVVVGSSETCMWLWMASLMMA